MQGGRQALSQVLAHVADGSGDLDWASVERLLDDEGRALVQQLRILALISNVHRSTDSDRPSDVAPRIIGRIEPQPTQSVPAAADERRAGAGRQSWGHLELLEQVGHGTFGEVYRAVDTHLRREVALKLLRSGRSPERLADRVLHEGRILARVRHQNVVVVHGAESHEGRVGLWMEYIRGATLEQLVRGQGPFSAREAALIGQDLCRAVAAVHGAGLVHRDIKAQNVMREEGGRVVLMDFGAVRSRESGTAGDRLTGTPLYLAPEVLAGGEATVRSDVYSLGVLLYYLVTGSFPTKAVNLDELKQAHAAGTHRRLQDARPDLPDAFVHVVERALAHSPANRFASAGEFQAALGRALDLAITEQVRNDARPARWRQWLLAPVACALLAVAGLWAISPFGGWRSDSREAILVAVLPFDRDAAIPVYLSESMARSVAELLMETGAVTVVSADAARVLKAGVGMARPGVAWHRLHRRGPARSESVASEGRGRAPAVGSGVSALAGASRRVFGAAPGRGGALGAPSRIPRRRGPPLARTGGRSPRLRERSRGPGPLCARARTRARAHGHQLLQAGHPHRRLLRSGSFGHGASLSGSGLPRRWRGGADRRHGGARSRRPIERGAHGPGRRAAALRLGLDWRPRGVSRRDGRQPE